MDWVNQNEANRTQLNPSEPNWNQLKPSETKWNQVNPSDSKWTHVNPSEAKWHWGLVGKKLLSKFYVLLGLDIWLVKLCHFMDSKPLDVF